MGTDGEWTYVYHKKRHRYPPYGNWYGGRGPYREMDRAPHPPYPFRGRTFTQPNQPAPLPGSRVPGPPAPPRGNSGRQTQRQMRDTPTDPAFGQMVRLLYKVIKMTHHLDNVIPREGRPEPKTVTRTIATLENLIQPASPTPGTLGRIGENAKLWGQNTLQILEEHYRSILDSTLGQIIEKPFPAWKEAFKIATKWAHRNLPQIKKEVLDRAEVALMACMEDLEEPQSASPPPQTTTQTQTIRNTIGQEDSVEPKPAPPPPQTTKTLTEVDPVTRRKTPTPAPSSTPQSEPQVRPISRGQHPEQSLTPIQPSRLALQRDSPSLSLSTARKMVSNLMDHPEFDLKKDLEDEVARWERTTKYFELRKAGKLPDSEAKEYRLKILADLQARVERNKKFYEQFKKKAVYFK